MWPGWRRQQSPRKFTGSVFGFLWRVLVWVLLHAAILSQVKKGGNPETPALLSATLASATRNHGAKVVSDHVPLIFLSIQRGEKRTFCVANLIRGDDGEMYADPLPFMWPPEEVVGRLRRLKLVGHAILEPQDMGAGTLMHTYQGIVPIPE